MKINDAKICVSFKTMPDGVSTRWLLSGCPHSGTILEVELVHTREDFSLDFQLFHINEIGDITEIVTIERRDFILEHQTILEYINDHGIGDLATNNCLPYENFWSHALLMIEKFNMARALGVEFAGNR